MRDDTPDRIVLLPRSGLVLMKGVAGALCARGSDVRLALDTRPAGGCPIAWVRNDAGHVFETNEAAIDWLDAHVLALRTALLKGTEERIARTCFEWDRGATWDERTNSDVENYLAQARAVLYALCEKEDGR